LAVGLATFVARTAQVIQRRAEELHRLPHDQVDAMVANVEDQPFGMIFAKVCTFESAGDNANIVYMHITGDSGDPQRIPLLASGPGPFGLTLDYTRTFFFLDTDLSWDA
jgi:hypothetical protein